MGRTVAAGTIVRDQVDVYQPIGSFKRISGAQPPAVTLFVSNLVVAWPVVDGTNVADSAISAGTIYFNEIQGSPGFYSIRFFPDRVGFWRLVFLFQVFGLESIKEYDVVPSTSGPVSPNSLIASFVKS